jgi:outer membrane protein
MTGRLSHSAMALFLAGSLVVTPAFAQTQGGSASPAPASTQSAQQAPPQPPTPEPATDTASGTPVENRALKYGPDFSNGKPWFPNIIAPYTEAHVPLPVLTNSPRLDQLIHDGKLMLSIEDAVSLALENNLDIAVQQFTPWIAETDLLRAKAGGAVHGLGATQNVTLGSSPSFSFDPIITGSIGYDHALIPVNNPFLSGVGTTTSFFSLVNQQNTYNVAYAQGFHTGTGISVSFDNTRSYTNSPEEFYNPSVQPVLTIQAQQQLLNGFGRLPNTRYIIEARNTRKVAELQLQAQIINTVTATKNAYWELVYARESVKVEGAAVATSQHLYNDNRKQVEIGTLAPIEIVRAESQLATDQQNQIIAQTTQLQDETVLLNYVTKDPLSAGLRGVELVPTTPITEVQSVNLPPIEDAVHDALLHRPEIQEYALNLKNSDIEVKVTKNALLPTVTLYGEYSGTGLAGNTLALGNVATYAPSYPIVDANGNPIPGQYLGQPATYTSSALTESGMPTALKQTFDNKFPTYAAGINFSLPLRNRSAQADNARAILDERQLQVQYRQVQNQIFLAVRNAQIALQQDIAQVSAADRAETLAQQTLDAEQKKYQLGASTTFIVIQDQRDLTAAQGAALRARINLAEAQINYDQALGHTLDVSRISVSDARTGGAKFEREKLIPGTPEAPDATAGK